MGCDQCHSQPASTIILPQQHHSGPSGTRQFREELCLTDKRLSGAYDCFLVHWRSHQSIQFAVETSPRAFAQPCDGRLRRFRCATGQILWQWFMQWIENKYAAILLGLFAEDGQHCCSLLLLCAKLGHFDMRGSSLSSLSLFFERRIGERSEKHF